MNVASLPQLSLANFAALSADVAKPAYDPKTIRSGIVHIGASNFGLAHLGSYINKVLCHDPNWALTVASLRTDGLISTLRNHDNLYLLCERSMNKSAYSVQAPIAKALYGPENPQLVVDAIASEDTKLVTMTVTNLGYYLQANGQLNVNHEDIVCDLNEPSVPRTIYWYLAKALDARQKTGKPLVIMSLDNVESNSQALKQGLLHFLSLVNPELIPWVNDNVDFPVTLVDRITPKVTDIFRRSVISAVGIDPGVIVGTERFSQLVVERCRFKLPPWETDGVQMVDDASPYWKKKFFMLNAGHQVVGIVGQRLGIQYIHEVMHYVPAVASLLIKAQKQFLTFLPGNKKELLKYCVDIQQRFRDQALNDTVERVTARTTSKIAQRVLASVEQALEATGEVINAPVFVTACWMLNLSGEDQYGEQIIGSDPDARKLQGIYPEIMAWVREAEPGLNDNLLSTLREMLVKIGQLVNESRFGRLADCKAFVEQLADCLVNINQVGVEQAIMLLP